MELSLSCQHPDFQNRIDNLNILFKNPEHVPVLKNIFLSRNQPDYRISNNSC